MLLLAARACRVTHLDSLRRDEVGEEPIGPRGDVVLRHSQPSRRLRRCGRLAGPLVCTRIQAAMVSDTGLASGLSAMGASLELTTRDGRPALTVLRSR
jgi:hypothetical protein